MVEVSVDVIPPAKADINGDTNICMGDSTVLSVSGATSYTWIVPPATTPDVTVSPKANTTYQVE